MARSASGGEAVMGLAAFPALLAAVKVTVWLVRALAPSLPWLPRRMLVCLVGSLVMGLEAGLLDGPFAHPVKWMAAATVVSLAACGHLHMGGGMRRPPPASPGTRQGKAGLRASAPRPRKHRAKGA